MTRDLDQAAPNMLSSCKQIFLRVGTTVNLEISLVYKDIYDGLFLPYWKEDRVSEELCKYHGISSITSHGEMFS